MSGNQVVSVVRTGSRSVPRRMPEAANFQCPTYNAPYKVVRVEVPITRDRELTCLRMRRSPPEPRRHIRPEILSHGWITPSQPRAQANMVGT